MQLLTKNKPRWSVTECMFSVRGRCSTTSIIYFYLWLIFRLKSLDLVTMKKLDSKVNIIPVVAKSDTITKAELTKFKVRNWHYIHGIFVCTAMDWHVTLLAALTLETLTFWSLRVYIKKEILFVYFITFLCFGLLFRCGLRNVVFNDTCFKGQP